MSDRTPIVATSSPDRPPIAPSSVPDRPPVDATSQVDRPSIAAAVTNNVMKARWGGKTQQNRRCRDLFKSLMRLKGNPQEPALQALCISAAELMKLTEDTREIALKEPTPKNVDATFKSEKAMRHALAGLGIDKSKVAADDPASGGYGLAPVVDDDDDDEGAL